MKKILIVDDDKVFLDSIVLAAEDQFENTKIFTSLDGRDAWSKYKEFNPNLIVTDHRMGAWSGEDFTRAIREENDSLPVILMTGFFDGFDAKIFDDVLYKPFKVEQFVHVAKNLIEK